MLYNYWIKIIKQMIYLIINNILICLLIIFLKLYKFVAVKKQTGPLNTSVPLIKCFFFISNFRIQVYFGKNRTNFLLGMYG